MQSVMRQNHERLGMTLPYPNGALQPAPTTKRLKEIVTPIQIIHWRAADGTRGQIRSALTLVQRQAHPSWCLLLKNVCLKLVS